MKIEFEDYYGYPWKFEFIGIRRYSGQHNSPAELHFWKGLRNCDKKRDEGVFKWEPTFKITGNSNIFNVLGNAILTYLGGTEPNP